MFKSYRFAIVLAMVFFAMVCINPTIGFSAENVTPDAAGGKGGGQANGKLWTWGRNTNGGLGQGDTTDRLNPTQVPRFNAPRAAVIPLH